MSRPLRILVACCLLSLCTAWGSRGAADGVRDGDGDPAPIPVPGDTLNGPAVVPGFEDGAWSVLYDPIVPAVPSARWGSSAVLDADHNRMIVFGGFDAGPGSGYRNDVWAMDLTTGVWSDVTPLPGPGPAPRFQHSAVFDPVRHRMIVFGGFGGVFPMDDVWSLDLSGGAPTWTPIVPAGPGPAARHRHTAIYDPVRDRMIVFAGNDASYGYHDTWELSLSGPPAWTELLPSGPLPPQLSGHCAVYDPVRDRMLVFGGTGRNDVWALALSPGPAWSLVVPSGGRPAARSDAVVIFDPIRNRLVLFGGFVSIGYTNDTWELRLAGTPTWRRFFPSVAPGPRAGHVGVYDPATDRLLIFGGTSGQIRLSDSWGVGLATMTPWVMLQPPLPPPAPPGRMYHAAVYDPVRDQMLVVGGTGYNSLLDVWSFHMAAPAGWNQLYAVNLLRTAHSVILDPARDRLLMFGGFGGGQPTNEVWAFPLNGYPGWQVLQSSGTPPTPRSHQTAIYDPVLDRLLIFGGFDYATYTPLNDVWALSLNGELEWKQLTPSGSPPQGRYAHTAVYDSRRRRMVVFGGASYGLMNDAWALSLDGPPAWTPILPASAPPSVRYFHAAIYDPVRDRMVIDGGVGYSFFNDAWALNFSGAPKWVPVEPAGIAPTPRYSHTVVYDSIRDRMVGFGGFDWTNDYRNDTWAITWGTPLAAGGSAPPVVPAAVDPPGSPRSLTLRGLVPNPALREIAVSFQLPVAAPVTIEMFDVGGRRVLHAEPGRLEAGPHRLTIGDARALPVGLYWLRLRQGALEARTTAAVMR